MREVPLFLKDMFPDVFYFLEGLFVPFDFQGCDSVIGESHVYGPEPPIANFAWGMGVILDYSLAS